MVNIESLLQRLQMDGGKKSVKRKPVVKSVRSTAKPVAKPVRSAAKPVKRRVFPKMRRSVGGFFEELNNMVTGQEGAGKDKKPSISPAAMAATAATPMQPPMVQDGGRRRVFKKAVKKPATGVKKVVKKPKRRMTYGGNEGEEVEVEMETEEVEMEQEGGRRRVFKKASKKPKRRPTSRGRMSYGGNDEAFGGRPRVFKKKAAKPRPSSRGRISTN
jgi:hypothetical protein